MRNYAREMSPNSKRTCEIHVLNKSYLKAGFVLIKFLTNEISENRTSFERESNGVKSFDLGDVVFTKNDKSGQTQ